MCKVEGAVIISGSPGLKDEHARKIRRIKDDSRACSLIAYGLECFLHTWYEGDLWNRYCWASPLLYLYSPYLTLLVLLIEYYIAICSLRRHPNFKEIVTSRMKHNDVHALAKVLSDLSVGRQP